MRGTTAGVRRRAAGLKTGLIVATTVILSLSLLVGCDWFNTLLGIDPYEPNDTIDEAHPIELGESYSAIIGENDADFFSFRTAHGSSTYDAVEISVTDVGPDLRIGIAVYDPNRELIFSRTINTRGADLTVVLRNLQSDDPYYVRFSGTWGVGGWEVDGYGDYHTQGPYTFRVRNLDANDEFAGNHSRADAYPIETDEVYNAVLVSNLEADYFSFTPTSESMRLEITEAGPDLYLGVALYLPNGELSGSGGHTASTKGATYGIDLNNMNTDATYHLRFSGTDGWSGWTVGGSFDHRSRGPYTFSLSDRDD